MKTEEKPKRKTFGELCIGDSVYSATLTRISKFKVKGLQKNTTIHWEALTIQIEPFKFEYTERGEMLCVEIDTLHSMPKNETAFDLGEEIFATSLEELLECFDNMRESFVKGMEDDNTHTYFRKVK